MDHLVLTVIAQDQPGLVERIAQCISEHGGLSLEQLQAHLETLADDLMVELKLQVEE